jgi:signal transduction histidine kinase
MRFALFACRHLLLPACCGVMAMAPAVAQSQGLPLAAPPALASTPAALWWFGCVALVLVAALAAALGYVLGANRRAQANAQNLGPLVALTPANAAGPVATDAPDVPGVPDANTPALAVTAPAAEGPGATPMRAAGHTPATPADTSDADAFSFTLSHDLRAPIRVVEGFTRIVKEDYGHLLDRVGNDHLDRVLGAGARMNLMIDALLTLARLSSQPLQRQPVNISQLAGYVMDDLRRAAPEREADITIAPQLQAQGDPTLLRLVLDNLLGNAWKYSAGSAKTQISLGLVPHGTGLAFEVRDNGAGFDMRSADRLFGLFQRLHSASEFAGHGVGLASVRRIVQRHGGQVWALSEPGRGAAFYFTLG